MRKRNRLRPRQRESAGCSRPALLSRCCPIPNTRRTATWAPHRLWRGGSSVVQAGRTRHQSLARWTCALPHGFPKLPPSPCGCERSGGHQGRSEALPVNSRWRAQPVTLEDNLATRREVTHQGTEAVSATGRHVPRFRDSVDSPSALSTFAQGKPAPS